MWSLQLYKPVGPVHTRSTYSTHHSQTSLCQIKRNKDIKKITNLQSITTSAETTHSTAYPALHTLHLEAEGGSRRPGSQDWEFGKDMFLMSITEDTESSMNPPGSFYVRSNGWERDRKHNAAIRPIEQRGTSTPSQLLIITVCTNGNTTYS